MQKLSDEEFVSKLKLILGDSYDYSKLKYVNAKTKIVLGCKEHGFFEIRADKAYKGCPKCANIKAGQKRTLSVENFLVSERVKDSLYDFSLVADNYVNRNTKVPIICNIHGIFYSTPTNFLRGRNCPLCNKSHKMAEEEFKEKLYKRIPKSIDISETVYSGRRQKIKLVCKYHGEFYKRFDSQHYKCPYCYKSGNKEEKLLYELCVNKFGISDVYNNYKSDKYPFKCDIYIKSLDLYIEYNSYWTHGGHWFDVNNEDDLKVLDIWKERSVKNKSYINAINTWTNRDLLKRDVATKNKLNYVVLWNNQEMINYMNSL